MVSRYEEELICDFAETYHIYDYRSLPARLAATLAAGLRADSRTKMKMTGMKIPTDTVLLAGIMDRVSIFIYSQSEDARKGINKPKMILPALLGESDSEEYAAVDSSEEFDRLWKQKTEE